MTRPKLGTIAIAVCLVATPVAAAGGEVAKMVNGLKTLTAWILWTALLSVSASSASAATISLEGTSKNSSCH
jgi:hypothetical protein